MVQYDHNRKISAELTKITSQVFASVDLRNNDKHKEIQSKVRKRGKMQTHI